MSGLNYIILMLFVAMLATGQLLFKELAISARNYLIYGSILSVFRFPIFYLSVSLYGGATLLWIWILSRVPITQAYPFVSITVIVVPLLGVALYGETVRPIFWVGVGLIAIGLFITQYGAVSG